MEPGCSEAGPKVGYLKLVNTTVQASHSEKSAHYHVDETHGSQIITWKWPQVLGRP